MKEDEGKEKGLDRRSFLRAGLVGATALLAGAGISIEKRAWAETIMLPDGRKIVLTKGVVVADKSLCSGCRTCEAVCATANSSGVNSPSLARLFIQKNYMTCEYAPHTCKQCSDPVCMKECPEGAIFIDEAHGTNARVIDESKCVGCESCIEACGNKYGIPRPRFDAAKQVCIKCHLCYGEPECVKYCPLGALTIVRSETGILTGFPYIQEQ
jgi:Fe-S-cluster-containing hydrogenase component 2